jgi:Uma2 family endonuclease
MRQALANPKVTFAEYVALENRSLTKHEFYDGEMFAMAGGSPEHALLAMSVGAELRAQLRGAPCRVFSSDLRIRVAETGLATYPDVSLVCGPLEIDPEDRCSVRNPRVLVEVLSPSTENYDREDKFAQYRQIPSLVAYVLVSQKERRIEVFHRSADGTWTLHEVRSQGVTHVPGIDCTLNLDEVYGDLLQGR